MSNKKQLPPEFEFGQDLWIDGSIPCKYIHPSGNKHTVDNNGKWVDLPKDRLITNAELPYFVVALGETMLDHLVSKRIAEKCAQIAVNFEEEVNPKWKEVKSQTPEEGIPVSGFNELWIDEDFNPKGIRECFVDDNGNWTYSKYCYQHDCYHTRTIDNFGTEGYLPPTHWMELPDTQQLLK